jgi:hypothetical protein
MQRARSLFILELRDRIVRTPHARSHAVCSLPRCRSSLPRIYHSQTLAAPSLITRRVRFSRFSWSSILGDLYSNIYFIESISLYCSVFRLFSHLIDESSTVVDRSWLARGESWESWVLTLESWVLTLESWVLTLESWKRFLLVTRGRVAPGAFIVGVILKKMAPQ